MIPWVVPAGRLLYRTLGGDGYAKARDEFAGLLFTLADVRDCAVHDDIGIGNCNRYLIGEWNGTAMEPPLQNLQLPGERLVGMWGRRRSSSSSSGSGGGGSSGGGAGSSSGVGAGSSSSSGGGRGGNSRRRRSSSSSGGSGSGSGSGGGGGGGGTLPTLSESCPPSAAELDMLEERSVACRELWMRFLDRSGSGGEGWLAQLRSAIRHALTASLPSTSIAILTSLHAAYPADGGRRGASSARGKDAPAAASVAAVAAAAAARAAASRWRGVLMLLRRSAMRSAHAALAKALAQAKATAALGRGGGDPFGSLQEASEIAERHLLARLRPFRRSPEFWACRRLWPARPPRPLTLSDFTLIRRYGKGSYGQVFAARKEDTMALVALKLMPFAHAASKRGRHHLRVERQVLEKAALHGCPFLSRLLYAFRAGPWLVLALPLLSGGTLQLQLDERGGLGLSTHEVRWIASQLALAVGALHGMGVLHRDIKPSNAILARTGYVVLSDFGLSGKPGASSRSGTRGYWSPETTRRLPQGEAADWWSLGVTLWYCACGKQPFHRRYRVDGDGVTVRWEPLRSSAEAKRAADSLDKAEADGGGGGGGGVEEGRNARAGGYASGGAVGDGGMGVAATATSQGGGGGGRGGGGGDGGCDDDGDHPRHWKRRMSDTDLHGGFEGIRRDTDLHGGFEGMVGGAAAAAAAFAVAASVGSPPPPPPPPPEPLAEDDADGQPDPLHAAPLVTAAVAAVAAGGDAPEATPVPMPPPARRRPRLTEDQLNFNTCHMPLDIEASMARKAPAELCAFIRALLARVPGERLGSGGVSDVRAHPFLGANVEWELLASQKLVAPFVPDPQLVYTPDWCGTSRFPRTPPSPSLLALAWWHDDPPPTCPASSCAPSSPMIFSQHHRLLGRAPAALRGACRRLQGLGLRGRACGLPRRAHAVRAEELDAANPAKHGGARGGAGAARRLREGRAGRLGHQVAPRLQRGLARLRPLGDGQLVQGQPGDRGLGLG